MVRIGIERALPALAACGLVAACGANSQSEVGSTRPLTNGNVTAMQTGNAEATLNQSGISYRLDNSGSLVIRFSATSTSAMPQTIMARASLYNDSGGVIGDAVGGETPVAPGASVDIQLNGPAPNGTVASARFELTEVAAPTPIINTPVPTATYTPAG
ncbi:MAG: hypothetical protein ABR498_09285 [Candidatus Dormibacteria bacterium]